MDIHLGDDLYDSFAEYQTRMLSVFDSMIGDVRALRSLTRPAAD
jgi:hypothetical protein